MSQGFPDRLRRQRSTVSVSKGGLRWTIPYVDRRVTDAEALPHHSAPKGSSRLSPQATFVPHRICCATHLATLFADEPVICNP